MSQTNSGTDTKSLLLSMLQRMQITPSLSPAFSTENDQGRQQSLQQWTGTEGGDGGQLRPNPKWDRGRSDDIGAFHPTLAVEGQKNTNGDSEDNSEIFGNLGSSVPLDADWDPISGIPGWDKRQTLPTPAPLDALIQDCQTGKENQTPETLPTQCPVLTPLCAHSGNSVPSTMWDHSPKRDGQHELLHLVDDKARWDMGWSLDTSGIWRDPMQMSPWVRGMGPPPGSEQGRISEGGEITFPRPCMNIPEQDCTGASNPAGPLERRGADTFQDKRTVGDPIDLPSALKQSRNPKAATNFTNPVDTSGGSDSGTWNMVNVGDDDSIISAQTLGRDMAAGLPPLGQDSRLGKGRACGLEVDYGGTPGIVEWDNTLETLTPHQNVWENTFSRKKRRETEWKTTTWTERIKERWRERHKNFGKRGVGQRSGAGVKDERKRDVEKEDPQFRHLTWHRIMDKNSSDTPTKEEQFTFQPPSRDWPNKALPTQSEGSTKGCHMRRSPIRMETTSQSAIGGDCYTQLNQKKDQPEREMQRILLECRSVDSQWDFTPGDTNCTLDRNTQKMYANSHPATNKEAVEHILIQPRASSGSWRSYQVQATDQSHESIPESSSNIFTKPVEVLENSAQMSRVNSNRKRDHSSGTRNDRESMLRGEGERVALGGRAEPREGNSTVNTGLQAAEGTNRTRVSTIPLYICQDSSLPLSPRSALRSSAVHDSESSTSSETVIKKRKIGDGRADTRRVRFAEQPVFLPDLQPFEFNTPESAEQPSLHTWILALKEKTKRKPRH
ncbi:uncharacterized protein zgc:113229 isoform X2 [Anguilla anguilla]|uniref:uncharacterized protein zgc:113229 isoform X2 n=1 Tax=Anguilla anguilla TaxID=7936 RepID=UPI0015AD3313|nr:uncharacterized protein zgc:113229 isoform X2 [Anguilla anguilla]